MLQIIRHINWFHIEKRSEDVQFHLLTSQVLEPFGKSQITFATFPTINKRRRRLFSLIKEAFQTSPHFLYCHEWLPVKALLLAFIDILLYIRL